MLHVILLFLLTVNSIRGNSLFSPNIYYSNVYASSVQSDSKPEYAVDADFFEETPTCLATDSRLPDAQGYHWILIDFGATIVNIREIRLVARSDEPENTSNPTPIASFVINQLDTPKSQLNRSTRIHMQSPSLNWDSPHFHLCPVTEQGSSVGHAVTLHCAQTYSGRWLAIRRQQKLDICLVNIYIEQAFEECFETLSPSIEKKHHGTVFRFIRHTPREACRSACMQSPDCEATMFTRQRYSGICQLITAFRSTIPGEREFQEQPDLLDCPEDKCLIEMNHCHGGTVQELEKSVKGNESQPESEITSHILEEEWLVKKPKTPLTDQSITPVYVRSVFFEGKLECDFWDCGPVYVTLVDANQTEHFCGRIDSVHVSHLEKAILFCNTTEPVHDPTLVRLRWYRSIAESDEASPKLNFHIQHGNIRVSRTKPTPPMTTTSTTTSTTHSTSTITSTRETPPASTVAIPIIVPQLIGSTKALPREDNSLAEFNSVDPMPTDNDADDSVPERKTWLNSDDDVDNEGLVVTGKEITQLEFNYPLNDQQPQSEERHNSFRSGIQVNRTMTAESIGHLADRVHDKRNILRQSNSPAHAVSLTGSASQLPSSAHSVWYLIYVVFVRLVL